MRYRTDIRTKVIANWSHHSIKCQHACEVDRRSTLQVHVYWCKIMMILLVGAYYCSYVLEVQYHSWYTGQLHIRGRSAADESNELIATFLILYLYLPKGLAATTEFTAIFQGLKQKQGCQLSQIIRETPDFGPYLPDSRLESEISRIITEDCHFL